MKINKLMLVPVAFTTVIAPMCITSCSNKLPSIKKMEVRQPHFMKANNAEKPEEGYKDSGVWINVYHFNDSPVGYVDVETYIIQSGLTTFKHSTKNKVTTIVNTNNNSTCVINYKTQTITFEDYSAFFDLVPGSTNPIMPGVYDITNYWADVKDIKYIKGKSTTIDLDYYHIPAYFKNGRGYLPLQLFRNVFNFAVCVFGEYNGVKIYEQLSSNTDAIVNIQKAIKAEGNIYTSEYFEFAYNLLALTLDLRFGMSQRQSRVTPGQTIKILPEGAYKAMEPYHDDLVSIEPNVSNNALLKLFSEQLDDGGHARYSNLNVLSTETFTGHPDWGKETSYSFNQQFALEALRNKTDISHEETVGSRTVSVINDPYREYVKNDTGDKIAYLTFDSFSFADNDLTESEKTASKPRKLQQYTDENNYKNDTMRLTMYANKKIQEDWKQGNGKIKDLVIDISVNGGGAAAVESFIASWLCNGITWKIHNPKSGAYSEYTVLADIDGDGLFDKNDTLPSDINLYVISSSASFSCGNLLPCQIYDYKPSARIIGNRSGGGACVVDSNLYTGWGSYYRGSGLMHLLRGDSTPEYRTSNDSGCGIHYYIDDTNDTERAKYYDRETINNWIWSK